MGIHPEKIKIGKPCTPKFIAALFTIARTWKKSRCPRGMDKEAMVCVCICVCVCVCVCVWHKKEHI